MIHFWLPVAAGICVGTLLGGRIAALAAIRLRRSWILVIAVAAQLALIFAPPVLPEAGLDPLRATLPLTTAALGVFVILNRHLPGMWLVLAGVGCNLVVIVANGGLMPVSQAALERAGMTQSAAWTLQHPGVRVPRSKDILLEPDQTRLYWLSDVIVSPPVPRPKAMSIGDLIIGAGLAYLTVHAMRPNRLIGALGRAQPRGDTQQLQIISSKEHQRGAALPIPPWASAGFGARPHPARVMA